MGKTSTAGANTKKAAGNAKKTEVATQKKAVANAREEVAEDQKWQQGAKDGSKKESAETKKAEAARKKAEKDALLREEEASLPTKAKSGNAKTAQKKTNRGLDLSQLDSSSTDAKGAVLNASGIDNALDALSLTNKSADSSKVDRHPERRFKAAYAAFEEKRLPEVEQEQPGLRRNQRVEVVRKEFEKSPDNPFNQVRAAYDATKEDVQTIRGAEKGKIEQRLGGEGN